MAPKVNDPFVRRLAKTAVIVLVVVLIVPALFTLLLYVSSHRFLGQPPDLMIVLIKLIPRLSSFPVDLGKLVISAVPLLLASFCYKEDSGRLNWTGRITLVLVMLGTLVGLLGRLLVGAEDPHTAQNVIGGTSTLASLSAGSEQTARTCWLYTLMFLGLRPKGGKV